MIIEKRIRPFLTDQEVALLQKHGALLRQLASGEVSPATENQRRFVESTKENGFQGETGASSTAWKRYITVQELLSQLDALTEDCKSTREALEKARKKAEALDLYVKVLKADGKTKGVVHWDQKALLALSVENRNALLKYERAFVLKECGKLSKKIFEKLTAIDGLWVAIHNYDKARGAVRGTEFSAGFRESRNQICGSCGMAVVEGHCKCSR